MSLIDFAFDKCKWSSAWSEVQWRLFVQILIMYMSLFFWEGGFAMVTVTTLSLRFNFHEDTLYVGEEVFDDLTGELSHATGKLSKKNDVGTFWLLSPGKYWVYGVSELVLAACTELLTSWKLSTVCIEIPELSKVKVEPGLDTIYELSDDTKNEVELTRHVRKVERALSP